MDPAEARRFEDNDRMYQHNLRRSLVNAEAAYAAMGEDTPDEVRTALYNEIERQRVELRMIRGIVA